MSRLLFLLLIILQNYSLPLQAKSVRAMWVVRYTLLDDRETDLLIRTAKKMQLTDLYVQVRALGKFLNGAEDNSFVNPNSTAYKNFKRIINDAHKQNIRVHAWLNVFYIHSRTDSVSNETHLAHSEKTYILRDANADSVPNIRDMKKAATEGIYIDPLNQKNYNFLVNQIDYLVDSLKVDGIHLDYFRYSNQVYIFSPRGRTKFILNNYVDPVSIYENSDSMEFDIRIKMEKKHKNFLKNNLTEFMANLKSNIAAKQQNIVLSVAVKPDWELAEKDYYQDWRYWIEKDICDQVVLMNYSVLDSVFYKNILKALDTGMANKILVGVATYNLDTEPIIRRLQWLEKNYSSGFSLFSYNDLISKPTLINRLANMTKQ